MARIGARRHMVSIQEPTQARDDLGGVADTWADVTGMDEVWAAIWPIGAREHIAAGQIQHDITHRVNIRYQSGITSKMRVQFGTRNLYIKSVINPDERNIELDLMCEETS